MSIFNQRFADTYNIESGRNRNMCKYINTSFLKIDTINIISLRNSLNLYQWIDIKKIIKKIEKNRKDKKNRMMAKDILKITLK